MPAPVWITGAGGLIGSYLVQTAPAHRRARGLTRPELDLTDMCALKRLFDLEQPHAIVHCAAVSRSTVCQSDPALARLQNVDVTRSLAELARSVPFVFLSTDLVFDGQQGNYVETDAVNPLSVYGQTKAQAEQLVLTRANHSVLRTSLNGGTSPRGDRGFNEELRRAWQEGRSVTLFTDEFRCPIPAEVTARAIWALLDNYEGGLYHLAGSQRLSRWEIGRLIAARWPQLEPRLEAASLKTYRGAPRPPDTSLNCAKLQQRLPFPLPGLEDWLRARPMEPF
jgi:dTDP-4-dehydrorhamnose reductase